MAAAPSPNSPRVVRPPPYHRSFNAFGAPIVLSSQIVNAPWPACRLWFFCTTAGVVNIRGEDGIAAAIPVAANVMSGPFEGGFSEITSTTAVALLAFVSWAASAG